jgi:hypothetical protein
MRACSAKLRGRFWPQEANQDRGLLVKLARWGELCVCTRGIWRCRGESSTVHVNQLARGGDAKPRGGDPAALPTARQDVRQVVAPRRFGRGLAALSGTSFDLPLADDRAIEYLRLRGGRKEAG